MEQTVHVLNESPPKTQPVSAGTFLRAMLIAVVLVAALLLVHLTPISAWQIVAGKLFSRLLIALTLLGLSLPILAIVRLLGGVEIEHARGQGMDGPRWLPRHGMDAGTISRTDSRGVKKLTSKAVQNAYRREYAPDNH